MAFNGVATRVGGKASFALGCVAALIGLLVLGEAYLRVWQPRDVREYFGGDIGVRGIYRSDPVLGVAYQSYAGFAGENARRLAQLGPLASQRPTWLFFGNSFVQAPGMLADTAQAALPERRIFHLARNEILPLRVDQARLLLEAGLRPQRIFFALMPHELWMIGRRPLSFIQVNRQGVITTRIRLPDPPWDRLVSGSRLAAIAWIRLGRAHGDPSFRPRAVAETPSERVQADLRRLFAGLGETSRKFAVPVTLVLIPIREQILGRASFGFQDAVMPLCRQAGFDCYDARGPLMKAADKPSLFLPDWHFTARGNRLLLDGLLAHLDALAARAAAEGKSP
jgi:hypothetical protein